MKKHTVRRSLLLLALPGFVAACGPATPPPEDQAPPPPMTGTSQPNESVPDEVVDPPVPPAEQDAFLDLFLTQEEVGPQYGIYEDVRYAMPDASDPVMSVYHLERAGRMVWMGRSDEPVYLVFDLLWLFPTDAEARDYLASDVAALSEGLAPQPGAPSIGDESQFFAGEMENPSGGYPVQSITVLFRVGRVLAKVYVTEGPNIYEEGLRLTRDDVAAVAGKLEQRLRAALAD